MGRLEQIIERNKNPYRKRFSAEIPAILLLIVLGLLVFTNLAAPPEPTKPAAKEKAVRDVPLMRAPKR